MCVPVADAPRLLTSAGACVVSAADLASSLGVCDDAWAHFGRHWEQLAPDPYAAELGVRRLRRYGRFRCEGGLAEPMPAEAFLQPHDSNPLYVGRDRHFEPLTDAFARDPLLGRLLGLLSRFATAVHDAAQWTVKVHPFRVIASAGGEAQPTPEGLHRDGVTLVTSLLINRRNAVGGESSVVDLSGRPLLTTTLRQPGALLAGDDRRTMHGVAPIRPLDSATPALRDVLVITFAA